LASWGNHDFLSNYHRFLLGQIITISATVIKAQITHLVFSTGHWKVTIAIVMKFVVITFLATRANEPLL